MKAAVYRGKGDLRVEEIPVPEIGPGEMLVRVEASGICGTDLKKIEKGLLSAPRVFGHEICGRVERKGAGVRRFREGDRVVLHHHVPCGACFYCARKAYAQCDAYKRNGTTAGFEPSGGGYAEYVKARDWIVERGTIAVPDGVRPEEAAFVEPVNTCLKAVQKAGIGIGETVLVVGQGPIGLILSQLCRRAGAEVLTSDTLEDRLDLSRRLGARAAFDARATDVPEEVKAATDGRGADCTVLAAVGPTAFRQATEATRPGGRVLIFSATSAGERVEVDLGALGSLEKDLVTSYSASAEIQETAARLVFDREVRVAELISHRFPMDRAVEAMEVAARPLAGVLKVMLQGAGA